MPADPGEISASLRAAARCMDELPYLRLRYGERGDAFARTDSGYLATLTRFPLDHVTGQVRWLAGVLASRGMPRWLMERHLDILAEELAAALPERAAEFGKLHEAACALRRERRAVLPQKSFDALAWAFARQAAEPIPRFGELALSAACDEACGIDAAVTSVTSWLEANETLPADWRASARDLIAQARKLVRQPQA